LALLYIWIKNTVSLVKRNDKYIDISCCSNEWENFLGWRVGYGSKYEQNVSVPKWIRNNKKLVLLCLRGLFETDGSVYFDRKYKMANFVTTISKLAGDVMDLISQVGFRANMQILESRNKKTKYTIRISRNAEKFIKTVGINKS